MPSKNSKTYPAKQFAPHTRFAPQSYKRYYDASIGDAEQFWNEQGQSLQWIKPYQKIKQVDWRKDSLSISWYSDGMLNVCANCVDRHLPERAEQTAIIWEGDDPSQDKHISYAHLHTAVCRFANVLKDMGVRKGDRVTIYLSMIPEAVYAMLACARIGAVHSVIFGGFSATAIAGRIKDCESKFVITATQGVRGGKPVPLKANIDRALEMLNSEASIKVLVVGNQTSKSSLQAGRDFDYEELLTHVDDHCPPETMSAEDPLFILYTSGSTGKPKGVLHTSGGYLVYVSSTHKLIFDYREGEVYWCAADVGWITGHSYMVYAPLCNGATTLIYEGVPNYPDASRIWQVCDKHQVNICYTAPTAIRALMREGDPPLRKTRRDSLRLLGTVGEPMNPEAWEWYFHKVGQGKCAIVDTWWQTETGGILMSPIPGVSNLKPGSVLKPMPGIEPALLDEQGQELSGEGSGYLVIKNSWPGQMRTVYGDHKRFGDTYFSAYEGYYFTGDGAYRDTDGDYWITGRVDDVLNVSGHRLGTAELESALVAHPQVAEAAVVGYPHPIKGQGIYAYVTLVAGSDPNTALSETLKAWTREMIGPIAILDEVQWAEALPKTRSGKIMRRILRKIAESHDAAIDTLELGDTSTLADSAVVEDLIQNRANRGI